ncbi:PorP/SprF family type IX secretion system membrane protein [Hymenobacter sp. BT664]|uniref:PorP/SprF family type IX secretion system membrane protein n=1 Tax=Hymenobacter montanus TaxID=2771359 RepID=A0A927BH93_9BACT|nr:PorP/SprF family type IX secretion system membrane protein [Hymenobacter montanus]MBD2770235.1 PorP/SprF family type IX secretion system membrane protein [Hymenobacter montanus]
MKATLFTTLLLAAAVNSAFAQQQPQFTHYGFNGMYLNPAYAGIKGQGEVNLIGRYQYLNLGNTQGDANGSPRTGMVSVSLPILPLSGGVGLAVYYDQVGEQRMTNAALSYSQHITLGSGKLGIGIQGTFTRLGKGQYRANDMTDPFIPLNDNDQKFDAGAGIWYESPKFYAGISMNNLARSRYQFANKDGARISSYINENHAYLTAGYNIEASSTVIVTPMVLVKSVLPGEFSSSNKFNNSKNYSFEGGVRGTIDDKYWVGVNYRHQESFSGLLGLSFAKDNALRVGYAFDFIAFNQEARAFSSHEIMLAYRLPKPGLLIRPAIRTPRYSF